jgi:hypothetical protein
MVSSIVFISGLEGQVKSRLSAWESSIFYWPRELRQALPNGRILVWSVTLNQGMNIVDAIDALSKTLLADLSKARSTSEARERPLVFIAYSLGGIVLESVSIKYFYLKITYPLLGPTESREKRRN